MCIRDRIRTESCRRVRGARDRSREYISELRTEPRKPAWNPGACPGGRAAVRSVGCDGGAHVKGPESCKETS